MRPVGVNVPVIVVLGKHYMCMYLNVLTKRLLMILVVYSFIGDASDKGKKHC